MRIDTVYFAQTHVLEPGHPYFRLVGGKDTLIKVHVLSETGEVAPPVTAELKLGDETTTIDLAGPATLPHGFCKEPGKVVHRFDDCFTVTIPGRWIRKGLTVTVKAGGAERTFDNLCIGPPIHLHMTMFDIHYFDYEDVDYPDDYVREIAIRRPVTELNVERVKRVLFDELVIPPCGSNPATRCTSEEDYAGQNGTPFNGKQGAALVWVQALQDAGAQRRRSLFFINIANVHAGGYAENFYGCGSLRRYGVLYHELAHSLDVEDLMPSTEPLFPYIGKMHGIEKTTRGGYHVGPTWGYDPRVGISPGHPDTAYFINPVLPCDTEKDKGGEWRSSPVRGGAGFDPDAPTTFSMFSDWSLRKMQDYMEKRIVLWNDEKQSYVAWNMWSDRYGIALKNDGVTYPIENDVEVYSIMAAVTAATPRANFIYPVIGPYRSGLIATFDPENPDDRCKARRLRDFADAWDVCLRVEQGGVTRTYMMPFAWRPDDDPLDGESFQTRALNVPARDGVITRAELLLTPNADIDGLPDNPQVLYARKVLSKIV
ncbi:MAG: M66 family metalloprotease [Lentisphaeria bacterium]|nr:M66 family metalloprotease [Lentisphaeria bacterium]